MIGLLLALFVRPRRVFARVSTTDDGATRVETGGLDRAENRDGLAETVDGLAAAMGYVPVPETEPDSVAATESSSQPHSSPTAGASNLDATGDAPKEDS